MTDWVQWQTEHSHGWVRLTIDGKKYVLTAEEAQCFGEAILDSAAKSRLREIGEKN